MNRIKWSKARKTGPTEAAPDSAAAVKGGKRAIALKPGSLAARAAAAEAQWLRTLPDSKRDKFQNADRPKSFRLPGRRKRGFD